MTGRCLGWFRVDIQDGTYEQHGNCAHSNADGDVLRETFELAPQPLAPVRIATGHWVGGTGNWEGLRGEFEIRLRSLRPADEGVRQAIGSKQGSCRIVR